MSAAAMPALIENPSSSRTHPPEWEAVYRSIPESLNLSTGRITLS